MTLHYTDPYLRGPQHKISIDLIGCGGTGSHLLVGLARINMALVGLSHPGLFVRAWDPDVVTETNIGRQLFSPADIYQNKATVLINRINRYYGLEWMAVPNLFQPDKDPRWRSNILITCTDTAASRILIQELISDKEYISSQIREPFDLPYYWLDIGNNKNTGQIVLGTIRSVKQPKSDVKTSSTLKNVVQKFPAIKKVKDDQSEPSCSMAEALNKQDLFVNSLLAQFACNLLWKLIKEGSISYHGCYVNLETLSVNPIRI
ncbi:MAG: PRTRC system ThiF family protein [Agriterribacter sp.]